MQLEFLFDFGSPNACLAHRVLPGIEARTGERFTYVPVLLGGIFKATGNVSPAVALRGIRNKPEYEALEMRRFVERHDLGAFRINPHFPVNTLQVMRGALAARREGVFEAYVEAVFRGMWEQGRKLDEPDAIRELLSEAGLDAEALWVGMATEAVKAELRASTDDAVARGVFGAPSFFVEGELFFGKDRLRDVEEEILRCRSS